MANLTDEQIREIAKTPLDKVDLAFPSASKEALKLKAVPAELRVFYDLDPLGKWVLLRKVDREIMAYGESKVVGAIDAERSSIGVVEIISELCEQKRIQVGDRVMFTNFMLELPDIEEATGRKDLFLVREEEIYCRLLPKPRPMPIEIPSAEVGWSGPIADEPVAP